MSEHRRKYLTNGELREETIEKHKEENQSLAEFERGGPDAE